MMQKLTLTKILSIIGILIFGALVGVFTHSLPTHAQIMAIIFAIAIPLWLFEIIPAWVTAIGVVGSTTLGTAPVYHIPDYLKLAINPVILLIFCGLCLASAVQKSGAGEQMLSRLLRYIGTRPTSLIIGLTGFSAFLAMWLTNTAAAAIALILTLPLIQRLSNQPRFRSALLLAIAFGANLGAMATPVGASANLIAIGFLGEHGITISFAGWMIKTLPFTLGMLIASSLLLMIWFRASGYEIPQMQPKIEAWNPRSISALIILGFTILGWLTKPWHGIMEWQIGLVAVGILMMTRHLTWLDFKQLDWGVLLLIWGGLSMGLGLEKTGLANSWIQSSISSIPITLTIGLLFLLAMLLSAVMSNTATAIMIVPLIIQIIPGSSSIPIGVALACSLGMFLPISTPANAIVYAKGWLSMRDMLMPGLIISLGGWVILTALQLVFAL